MTPKIPTSTTSRVLATLLLACLAACPTVERGPGGLPDDGRGYPGLLRAPTAMPGDFLWQQRVTAEWGPERERQGFDAALQKQGDTMTLVGLTPMGTKAFVVTQTGEAITVDNDSGREMPFPPRYIMLDVQRAFFPWLPEAAQVDADGVRAGTVGDERVTERFEGGHLRERCFARLDGQPAGTVCVTYEGWAPGAVAPARAVLANGWYGYRLEVETHAQQALDAATE